MNRTVASLNVLAQDHEGLLLCFAPVVAAGSARGSVALLQGKADSRWANVVFSQ
jgi:hypothetical protein